MRGAVTAQIKTTHGMSRTPEWNAWVRIKQRCYNPKVSSYRYYGARGIKVCDRWIKSFDNFFEDMGLRPSWATSFDRIDNDKDYTPENCRWADATMQSNNRRNIIKIDGLSLKQWCKKNGQSYKYVHRVYTQTNRKR